MPLPLADGLGMAEVSLHIPNNYEIRWTGSGKGLWPSEFHENVTGGVYDVPFELWFLRSQSG